MLLLLNLVIAIMSDTYSRFANVKLGLYSQGIIESMPSYKNDKRYGGLICMIPPFNLIAYILLPIYHCKAKKNLISFNSKVCKSIYFPFCCFFTLVFLLVALILTPLAWLKIIFHKFLLAKRTGQKVYILYGVLYIFFGLPVLLLTAIVDSCWFFVHQFQWKTTRV